MNQPQRLRAQAEWKESIGVHLVAALIILNVTLGCDQPDAPPSNEPSRAAARKPDRLIPQAGLFDGSFLLLDDQSHRWRFSQNQFVVESFGKPLPASLTAELLTDSSDDYRISGAWRMNDARDGLELTALRADRGTPRDAVQLSLEPKGADRVLLGGFEYRLAESLPLREVLPDRVYVAAVADVPRGNLLRVRTKDGLTKEVRLFGVVCPAADQPYGPSAIDFCREMTANSQVFVKVFGNDADGREIAQVWVEHLRYLNMELLTAGLAWHDKRTDDEWILATAEDDSRELRRGLWADDAPQPPWIWPDAGQRSKSTNLR